tara:strand:- start:2036 stop:2713 length:678 start_codon:yes stop_codon:yes gene_type:complete
MDKKIKTIKTIKKVVLGVVALTLFSSISLAVGTFYPNPWVKKDIIESKEKSMIDEWKSYGLFAPAIEYSTNTEFVIAVGKCIGYHNLMLSHDKRIPRDIIVAMAVLETGYGKSRFAKEANNLFGIRTWDSKTPQLKPLDLPEANFGVKKYKTKCDSVKDMISIINRISAYQDFRLLRAEQLKTGKIEVSLLIDQLHKWSTNPKYTVLVKNKSKAVEKILIKHYGQ